MKVFKLLILNSLITLGTCYAQAKPYKLVNRFCECPEFEYERGQSEYKLKSIKESTNEMEIRINYKTHQVIDATILISKSKRISKAYFYIKRNAFKSSPPPDSLKIQGWEEFPSRKYNVADSELDTLLATLERGDIRSLPSTQFVNYQYGNHPPQYEIELKQGSKFHTFTFYGILRYPDEIIKTNGLEKYKIIAQAIQIFFKNYAKEFQEVINSG